MTTLDANTRVNIGTLVALLGLGAGGIWKIASITTSIDVGNTRLESIDRKVSELNENMKSVLPRGEFEAWQKAQTARDQAQDSRMDRFDRLLDGDGHHGEVGGK